MIATGAVKLNNDGNVISIEVTHAPSTGNFVRTEMIDVQDNLMIGHTFRMTDPQINYTPDPVERIRRSSFVINNQFVIE